jgi:hypothetical protein
MRILVILSFLAVLFHSGKEVGAANEQSFQIEMVPWEKVNTLIPKYTKFIVLDVETGKQFRVQRRAGSHHADVQPLTSKDTKIMKSIYGGKWSWKRRAIIIIHKDHWIAASMHGMPHGAGALVNNFPGHFCIHFFGSTTHKTNSMDLAHKLMIYKSAGRLGEYFGKANPYEVIQAFAEGLKQQDEAIVSMATLQNLKWKPVLIQFEGIAIKRMPLLPAEDLTNEIILEIPIELEWYQKNIGKHKFCGKIHLVRFSPYESWKIDSLLFLEDNGITIKKNS